MTRLLPSLSAHLPPQGKCPGHLLGVFKAASKVVPWLIPTLYLTSPFPIDLALAGTFPSDTIPNLRFQTSSPKRCANIGDWYTTDGASCTTPTTSTDKIHRFFIDVTQGMIDEQGGTLTIYINDADSNAAGSDGDETSAPPDPARFQLLDSSGIVLQESIILSSAASGTSVQFTVTEPGTYTLTSLNGASLIPGDQTGGSDSNSIYNDDDNSFTITFPDPILPNNQLLVGQVQSSFQHNNSTSITANFYFLLGPDLSLNNLYLRNFDVDNGGTLSYFRPSGGAIGTATRSGNAVWNGGGSLNTGGDTVSGINTVTGGDAGIWRIQISSYTANNQIILEANSGTPATGLERLVVFDRSPSRAGNFLLTDSGTETTSIGVPVDHPFEVTNLFFTNDIINFTLAGTDANYTVELLDANGNPLVDTDGDGNLDTGILQTNETRTYILRVTPGSNAIGPDTTTISGVSFMDTRVVPNDNITLSIDKTTQLMSANAPNLILVKRITAINNAPFTSLVDGINTPGDGNYVPSPQDADDNHPNWPGGFLQGEIRQMIQPGDDLEFTMYFLSTGNAAAQDVLFCDLVPNNVTFVEAGFNTVAAANGPSPVPGVSQGGSDRGMVLSLGSESTTSPYPIEVSLTNLDDGDAGQYVAPGIDLTTIDLRLASCGTNTNGAIVVNLGTLPNATSAGDPPGSYGFVRFKGQVN